MTEHATEVSRGERYGGGDDDRWRVSEGSVLDPACLDSLGTFDVVYSRGVLHHTASMSRAVDLVARRVGPAGSRFIALYDDQRRASRRRLKVKRAYVALNARTFVVQTLRRHPGRSRREYGKTDRGMSLWRDVVEWVGGPPLEVSRPEQVLECLRECGFTLIRMRTCGGGHGCDEYVVARQNGGV